jgi:peptidoglycan/LPS O-acetylase OafA/YrhL
MKVHFPNLDSLRTIAFLGIFAHHGFYTESPAVHESTVFRVWEKVRAPAGFGVPLFFVLSGFLITYLILEEKRTSGRFNIRNFYVRRILRIWPLYYAVLLFGFVIFPWARHLLHQPPHAETADPVWYGLFLGNFDQIRRGLPYGVGLGVTWSLSVEEQFYVFWPLLLLLARGARAVYAGVLAVMAAAVVGKYLWWLPDTHTLVCMSYLGSGALLANALQQRHPVLERIERLPRALIVALYLAGIAFLYVHPHLYYEQTDSIAILIFGLYFAFVIYDQAVNPNSPFKLGRLPLLERLGKYTYGFYLLHTICNFLAFRLLASGPLGSVVPEFAQSMIVRPACSLLLTILVGVASYHWFERPFLSLKSRFSTLDTSA